MLDATKESGQGADGDYMLHAWRIDFPDPAHGTVDASEGKEAGKEAKSEKEKSETQVWRDKTRRLHVHAPAPPAFTRCLERLGFDVFGTTPAPAQGANKAVSPFAGLGCDALLRLWRDRSGAVLHAYARLLRLDEESFFFFFFIFDVCLFSLMQLPEAFRLESRRQAPLQANEAKRASGARRCRGQSGRRPWH